MIQLENDPAIAEIKRIVENELRNSCKFMYANLHEANYGLDGLDDEDEFPVFLFIASDKSTNKTTESGLIIRTIEVFGMMLNSESKDPSSDPDRPTIDYTSEEIDPYINQMRSLCDNLIYNLNKSSLSYVQEPIQEWEFTKIYEKFDRHLFGGGLSFKWSVNLGINGCFPIG